MRLSPLPAQAPTDVSANNLSGCFHNRDNASNIVISPAGKHSASGEARYSVTFKETETDSPAIGIRGLPALHRHP